MINLPQTDCLKYGDRVHIELLDDAGIRPVVANQSARRACPD